MSRRRNTYKPDGHEMAQRRLETAAQKGRDAARLGALRSECPYDDLRAGRRGNIVTYSRAYRNAWFKGYDEWHAGQRATTPTEESK